MGMLTLDKIYHAAYVLKAVARKTDLIAAPNLHTEGDVYLKTENLQVTGSFKVRGAYYKISQLTDEEKAKGVIASSAGNHAQGVALAASRSGIPSVICMPDGAPISKVEATKAYGAQVCLVKGAYVCRRALKYDQKLRLHRLYRRVKLRGTDLELVRRASVKALAVFQKRRVAALAHVIDYLRDRRSHVGKARVAREKLAFRGLREPHYFYHFSVSS